jgi:hypothetical protein
MEIDNSNKRYSVIIAGILVMVLVSIFVAFALGIGGFKTDFPDYISPSSVGSPYDAENEVSKTNILGNNADVSIAQDWEVQADPLGTTILLVPDTAYYVECGTTYWLTVLPDWFPLLDDGSIVTIPNKIEECMWEDDYWFTIAIYGCYDVEEARLIFEQCDTLEYTIDLDDVYDITGAIASSDSDNIASVMGLDDLNCWQFYLVEVESPDEDMEFCANPDYVDPPVDSFYPDVMPPVPYVDITLEVDFETDGCGADFTLILSQK